MVYDWYRGDLAKVFPCWQDLNFMIVFCYSVGLIECKDKSRGDIKVFHSVEQSVNLASLVVAV